MVAVEVTVVVVVMVVEVVPVVEVMVVVADTVVAVVLLVVAVVPEVVVVVPVVDQVVVALVTVAVVVLATVDGDVDNQATTVSMLVCFSMIYADETRVSCTLWIFLWNACRDSVQTHYRSRNVKSIFSSSLYFWHPNSI